MNNSNRSRGKHQPPQSQQQSLSTTTTTSTRSSYSSTNNNTTNNRMIQLQVLYTHQKTKKKKSWKDGRLTLSSTSGHCTLYDACPIPGEGGTNGQIDALELTKYEADSIRNSVRDNNTTYINNGELTSEKYLIQIENVWVDHCNNPGGSSSNHNNPLWNKQPMLSSKFVNSSSFVGGGGAIKKKSGMKKLLTNKFRIPQKVIPLHPEEKRKRALEYNGMYKRSRVLQPGGKRK